MSVISFAALFLISSNAVCTFSNVLSVTSVALISSSAKSLLSSSSDIPSSSAPCVRISLILSITLLNRLVIFSSVINAISSVPVSSVSISFTFSGLNKSSILISSSSNTIVISSADTSMSSAIV